MKKSLAILAVSICIFTLTSCQKTSDKPESSAENTEKITEQITEQTVDSENRTEDQTAVQSESHTESQEAAGFDFSTEDINGNPVSASDFTDAKVIMVNFWEPWCGPCVGEMPDLEKLYETYKDQGLVILGSFSTSGADEDVKKVVEDIGITYPIIRTDRMLQQYMTAYVPTTIFVDGEGNILTEEPYIGAKSAAEWERIITDYLSQFTSDMDS